MPLPCQRKRKLSQDGSVNPQRVPNNALTSQNGSGNNVKVVVRVRPENQTERDHTSSKTVVRVMNENVLVFDPKEQSSPGYGSSRKRPRDIRKRQNKDLKFAFDAVFGSSANNKDLYNHTTKSILDCLLTGYNCSVFAYGATGAGKTHTMLGNKDNPGVMYYTMVDLYNRIEALKDTKICEVAVSYLEVYNEQIRDLLMVGKSLPIREDPANGVVVQGLSLHKPTNAEELLYMLQFGNTHRTQHPTDANAESSRSHAVFQVFVRQKDRTANLSTEVRIGKMCLVDLAGSERATVTKNRGSRLREGANINRSLLALGNVINALAENKNKGHIPYRDSKLTRLLKDSLGGNCQTVMIAAVSPSSLSYEDTYNTLRYADRAKHIKAVLKKNVLNVDFHVARYGQIVADLRKEIEELKGKLVSYETGTLVAHHISSPVEDFSRFQSQIKSLYSTRLVLRGEQLAQEIHFRDIQWQIYRKERSLARLAVLNETSAEETVDKVKRGVKSLRERSEVESAKCDNYVPQLDDIRGKTQELDGQLDSVKTDGQLPEVLGLTLQVQQLQTTVQDSNHQLKYMRKVVRGQERELQSNDRMLLLMLQLVRRQHYIIKGHKVMTSDLQAEYDAIQKRVEGQELNWADQSRAMCGFDNALTLADMLSLPKMSSDSVTTVSAIPDWSPSSISPSLPKLSTSPDVKGSPAKARRVLLSQKSVSSTLTDTSINGQPLQASHPTPVKSTEAVSTNTPVHSTHKVASERAESCQKVFKLSAGHTPAAKKSLSLGPSSPSAMLDHKTDGDAAPPTKKPRNSDCGSSRISHKSLNDTFSRIYSCELKDEQTDGDGLSKINETFTLEDDEDMCLPVSLPVVLSGVETTLPTQAVSVSLSELNRSLTSNVNMSVIYPSAQMTNSSSSGNACFLQNQSCFTEHAQSVNQSTESLMETEVSGESTLLNSVCSVSTLCSPTNEAGVDLSHERTTNACGQDVTVVINRSVTSQLGSGTVNTNTGRPSVNNVANDLQTAKSSHQLSLTVTKSAPTVLAISECLERKEKGMSVRAIKFDSNNLGSPSKGLGKSYTDVIATPSPARLSLRDIGNNKTPSMTPTCNSSSDSFSSGLTDSEGDPSLGGRSQGVSVSLTKTRLFDKTKSDVAKKNVKNKTDSLGMPSLSGNIIFVGDKPKLKKMQSFTPRYMQSTKAHRVKHVTRSVSSTRPNDSTDVGRKGSTSPVTVKPVRKLLSSMRSKSMSNLSGKAAWQL